MVEMTQELMLRYLLELSTDIRIAMLVDDGGSLLAAAPEQPADQLTRAAADLAREARQLADAPGDGASELEVRVDGGSVFLLREQGVPSLVCVTGPFALPGLILHDMRVALGDLRRGAPQEIQEKQEAGS